MSSDKKKRVMATSKEYSKQHNLKTLFSTLFSAIKQQQPANVHRFAYAYFKEQHKKAGESAIKTPIKTAGTGLTADTVEQVKRLYRESTESELQSTGSTYRQTDPSRDKKVKSVKMKDEQDWTMHVKKQGQKQEQGEIQHKPMPQTQQQKTKKEYTAIEMQAAGQKHPNETPEERQIRKERQRAKKEKERKARALGRKTSEFFDFGAKEDYVTVPRPRRGSGSGGRSGRKLPAEDQQRLQGQPRRQQGNTNGLGVPPNLGRKESSFMEDPLANSAKYAKQSFMQAANGFTTFHDKTAVKNAERRKKKYEEKVKQAYRDKYGDHGTEVFAQMQDIPQHPAVFTLIITVIMVAVMLHSILTHPVAKWGLGAQYVTFDVDYFNGVVIQQQIPEVSNMWYGPDQGVMIQYGAKYTPCMRKQEDFVNKTLLLASNEMAYGACTVEAAPGAPMDCFQANEALCSDFSSERNSDASNRTFWLGRGSMCDETGSQHRIVGRPCCYGIQNDCHILPEAFCTLLGETGYSKWHKEAQLCSHVNCMEGLCGMSSLGSTWRIGAPFEKIPINSTAPVGSDGVLEWNIPNQFWRFFSPIFMHVGVGHLLFNMAFQVRAVAEIEQLAGFWNVALMYFLSGFGGNIFAATMEGVSVSAGASSSLYGIIGVQTVDLFQSWQIIDRPMSALFQQMFMNIIVLGIGTLPQVDNFAHAGGFIVGVVTGIAFLPYIHFSKVDKFRKFILKNLSKIVISTGTLGSLVVFYTVSDPNFCTWCKYINCVPYMDAIDCDMHSANITDTA